METRIRVLSVLPEGTTKDDVKVFKSNDHIHLSVLAAKVLFGSADFPFDRWLGILGQFASTWKVTFETASGDVITVRVVGGPRAESQLEVSLALYARIFGISEYLCPSPKMSGDLEGARYLKVNGPNGSFKVAVIIAANHAHSDNPALVGKSLRVMDEDSWKMIDVPVKPGAIVGDQPGHYQVHVHLDRLETDKLVRPRAERSLFDIFWTLCLAPLRALNPNA